MKNINGGGAKTNFNGLKFEQETDLNNLLKENGFVIQDVCVKKKKLFSKVSNKDKREFISCPKHFLYNYLDKHYTDSRNINSKRWQPDECLIDEKNKKVYIIEKKFQNTSGSVDEKLPNCEFKLFEYQKLFNKIDYNVEFIYIFNDWFKKDEYKDTLDYISSKKNCSYYFNELPLKSIGL